MKHTILMVDDDVLILNTLKQRFETWETEVYAAATPEEAKKILATVTPEVVVLDLLLTKEDGSTGILDFLQSQPRLQQVPVIVLTNLDKPELKQMLLDQGVKEYLIKGSLTLDDLYGKVRSYLEPDGNKP
ncbi:MAG TPA: response regulator [Patescibacteria group bacterium]|nr:response regulator [Patescibacteria group bacterium]